MTILILTNFSSMCILTAVISMLLLVMNVGWMKSERTDNLNIELFQVDLVISNQLFNSFPN